MKYLISVLIALLLLSGCSSSNDKDTYNQVTMDEAIAMMDKAENYIIVDVRTAEEYASGHIPGAINIPNETIKIKDVDELKDKEQLILVYCRSGNRSKQASEKLVKLGYTNIVEFGGIKDWPGEIVVE